MVTERFSERYSPREQLLIDEGCIPFKGNVHFKCYNPKKISKYHIKSFKVVDSTNNYCLMFDLYTGDRSYENVSEFGKVHDLVFRLLQPYLGKGHHVYMDNWYKSPVIFHNLTLVGTGATGTVRSNRVGLPNGFSKVKVTEKVKNVYLRIRIYK